MNNWHFYLAFSYFRMAAICQGVYKRGVVTHSLTVYNSPPFVEPREHRHVTGMPGNRKETHVGE